MFLSGQYNVAEKRFNLFINLFIFLKLLSLLLATLVKNKPPTSDGFVRETDHETRVHVHPLWPCFLQNSTPNIFMLPSCPFALKFFVFPAVNLHHWLTLNLKERRNKTNKTEENRHYWSRWKLTQTKLFGWSEVFWMANAYIVLMPCLPQTSRVENFNKILGYVWENRKYLAC